MGLKNKGHLGVGADADVAIFNINPETTDIAKKYKTVRKAFGNAAYTIKDGIIVVKDAEVVANTPGRTMWLDVQTKEPCRIDDEMKRKFRDYWTVEYDNYPVTDHYLKVPEKLTSKGKCLNMITLTPKRVFDVPVQAACITPDVIPRENRSRNRGIANH